MLEAVDNRASERTPPQARPLRPAYHGKRHRFGESYGKDPFGGLFCFRAVQWCLSTPNVMLSAAYSDDIDMKATWSFPALVRAIAPNPKEERLCLVSKEDEFEIKEIELSSMPLVMSATVHYQPEKVEYRLHNGHLYKSIDEYDEVLEIEHECQDTLAYGNTHVYRVLADEIMDIMKSGTVRAWPKNAQRQNGTKSLEKSGIRLLPEGETDLAYWKDRFKTHLDRFIVAGGKAWLRTTEPVWSVSLEEPHAFLEHASCFSDKRDEFGKRHYATDENASHTRMFSMHEFDAMSALVHSMPVNPRANATGVLDSVEVFIPEAFKLDVDRLEMDRIARALVGQVGKSFSQVKPGGGETLLEVAPSSLVVAWSQLRDFMKAYNPIDGVPDELERKFSDFVAEADGMAAVYGPALVSTPLREAVDYAFARWENRAIEITAAPLFAARH